jgi:hypothetical protein
VRGEKEKLAGSAGEEGGPAEWTRHTLDEAAARQHRCAAGLALVAFAFSQ